MLNPQLERALEERRAQSSISEQVKWTLKRLLAGSRPEISAVARELGLSDRTLQRRIIDDGATFRQLLLGARQELDIIAGCLAGRTAVADIDMRSVFGCLGMASAFRVATPPIR